MRRRRGRCSQCDDPDCGLCLTLHRLALEGPVMPSSCPRALREGRVRSAERHAVTPVGLRADSDRSHTDMSRFVSRRSHGVTIPSVYSTTPRRPRTVPPTPRETRVMSRRDSGRTPGGIRRDSGRSHGAPTRPIKSLDPLTPFGGLSPMADVPYRPPGRHARAPEPAHTHAHTRT